MHKAAIIICITVLLLAGYAATAQTYTGKWRWQVKASASDLQTDYLLELDLKQEGKKVVGTRTLYLRDFENIVVWVEGEVKKNGEMNIASKRVLNFKLPDSILVAIAFSYTFKKDKFNEEMMVGMFMPMEDTTRRHMRKFDPGFYDAIYLRPAQAVFQRLADTLSNTFDSIYAIQYPPAIVQAPVKPAALIQTEIEHTLTIPAGDVTIDLYDNGTVDGDIVTLLLNDRIVSEHQKLGITPITIKIKKEDLGDSTMVIMQAENLGDIPPNTALMLITVAGKRYDLNLNSDLQKRAAVVLYKKK